MTDVRNRRDLGLLGALVIQEASESFQTGCNYTTSAFTSAIRSVQRIYKLSLTGKLDFDTLRVMSKRRCGNRDIIMPNPDDDSGEDDVDLFTNNDTITTNETTSWLGLLRGSGFSRTKRFTEDMKSDTAQADSNNLGKLMNHFDFEEGVIRSPLLRRNNFRNNGSGLLSKIISSGNADERIHQYR